MQFALSIARGRGSVFWGALLALLAAILAVISKWNGLNGVAIAAGFLLLAAFAWAGVCVWATAGEIK